MLKDEYLSEPREYPNFVIEFNGEGEGVAEYTDYLEWHVKNKGELISPLLGKDGWLTDAALSKIRAAVSKHMRNPKLVDVTHVSGDEPGFEVTYGIGKHDTEESAWKAGYELYAVMANFTDPGTYGWNYLFVEVQ